MTTSHYTVQGMTCGHCVSAVTEELSALNGVTGVAVDLPTGRVAVESSNALNIGDVRAAVVEAGYVLAPENLLPLSAR